MKKLFNKKFALILGSTIALLVILTVAIVFLTKENTKSFTRSGYIIASSKEESTKYYFDEGTNYKTNINSELVFTDTSGEKVNVETDNFLHYIDGGIKFLKNGVIMDLDSVNSTIVPYYNITNKSQLEYSKKSYYIETTDKTLAFNNLIGRISENKYIVAGVDINLQLAGNDNTITGDYFELTFIEDGIIKVENQEVSYQTTAENSYVLVNDNIKIDLGLKKIYYNDEEKMSLTQMTIDGNENIEIIPNEEEKEENNNGSNQSDGTNNDNTGNNNGNIDNQPNTDNPNNPSSENPNDGTGNGDETGDGSGGNGTASGDGTGSSVRRANIEMIEAEVGVNSLNAKFYINDPDKTIKGNLVIHITNTDTGKRVYSDEIKGKEEQDYEKEYYVGLYTLAPDTNYILSINEENNGEYDTQYFQKLFRTDTLGISLEKKYVTSDSIAYEVVFEEDSEVKSVRINLNDEKYNEVSPSIIINKDNNIAIFEKLKNNTTYNLVLDNVILGNLEYNDTYTSYKTVKTLKKTPLLSELSSTTDEEKNTFTIGVDNIVDEDNSITKYSYYIYNADEITIENKDTIEPVQVITKNDASKVKVNIDNEKIFPKTNYKFKVVAEYYDNEKYGEYETELSGSFILAGRPYISFEMDTDKSTFNKIAGTVIINDENCTVPINGRSCSSIKNYTNNFKIVYHMTNSSSQTTINIDQKDIYYDEAGNPKFYFETIELLSANTEYIFDVYGNVDLLDGNGEREGYLIGTFRATTNGADILTVDTWEQNQTGVEDLINVTSRIISTNNNDRLANSLNNLTFNLYSGDVKVELELGRKLEPIASKTVSGQLKDTYYKNLFIINTLDTFEIENIEALKGKTNGNLQKYYTIEITDAYDEGYINPILLENNIFVFETPAMILLEDQLTTPEIHADEIENQNLIIPEGTDRIYDKDYDDKLSDTTIVGYKVTVQASIEKISTYFGGGNPVKELIYYVCDADINTDCDTTNAVAKRVVNLEQDSSLETIFYLNYGTDYNQNDYSNNPENTTLTRGHNYIFKAKFNIDTNNDNEIDTLYPTTKSVETGIKETPKQAAAYSIYIFKTTENQVNYKYSFTDVDNSLYDKKFYYNVDDGEEQTQDFNTDNTNDEYYDLSISGLSNDSYYNISFKQALVKNTKSINTKKIGEYIFDGKYVISPDEINFELVTSENDNRLKVLILENELNKHLLNRISAIQITLSADGVKDYQKTYPLNLSSDDLKTVKPDIEECTTEKGTYQCIIVDYADIKDFIRKEVTVKLTAYYDSGIIDNNFSKIEKGNYILQSNNIYNPDKIKGNYIYINKSNGISSSSLPSGIYEYISNTNKLIQLVRKINLNNFSLSNDYIPRKDLTYMNDGIYIKNSAEQSVSINNKLLSQLDLSTTNNKFKFNSIIPKIKVETSGLINGSVITITPVGLTEEKLQNEFLEEDGKYYYYLKIYETEEKTEVYRTEKIEINYDKSSTIELTKYMPNNTKYYFEVYAKLKKENEYKETLLFDESNTYATTSKTYEFNSLSSEQIGYTTDNYIEYVTYPTTEKDNNNTIKIKSEIPEGRSYGARDLIFKFNGQPKIGAYDIKFELTDINGETVFEEIVLEGATGENIKLDSYEVYKRIIEITTDEEESKKNTSLVYKDLVFGGNYYTLKISALTEVYDQNEKEEVVIYNDTISLIKLSEPQIFVEKEYQGVEELKFNVTVFDKDGVIKNGEYCAELLDKSGKKIELAGGEESTKCGLSVLNLSEGITFGDSDPNTSIGLTPNTLYIFRVYADIYANNIDATAKERTVENRTVLSTSTSQGVALGSVAAYADSSKTQVTLSFSSGVNIGNIKKIEYSLMEQGGKEIKSETYIMDEKIPLKEKEIYKAFNVTSEGRNIKINPEGLILPSKSYIVVNYYVQSLDESGNLIYDNNGIPVLEPLVGNPYDYSIEF